ncbi:MAG: amidohydrolase family protein [Myxococcales bacterium]|nr:amidohydrolase family protein [Myxococcales bacterium]
MIIDIDTHWERSHYEPGEHPLEPWRDQLPSLFELLRFAIGDDLLRCLPEDQQPTAEEFLPVLAARQRESGKSLHPAHDSTVSERLDWMDRVGTDHCLVNPGAYFEELYFLGPEFRAEGVKRCNRYLGEQLADTNRLHPIAMIDFTDLDAAVTELEEARSLGARGFFLVTDYGRPPGAVSPGHPDWDRVWSAATSLGMMAVIHVGNTFRDYGGWGDIGWQLPESAGIPGLVRLANTKVDQTAANLLSALLFGGVLQRHPKLTVLIEETHAGWLPWFVKSAGRAAASNPVLGDWPYSRTGEEMLRDQVRLTPLPGFGDDDALEVLAALPDMTVWSSDYPHQEGNADPIALYQPALDGLDAALRRRFLGGTMEESFARMGDPL